MHYAWITNLQYSCSMKTLTSVIILMVLAGCATLPGRDSPNVRVAGLEPMESEGLELRFALKLRVQNPNGTALAYDGLSVSLDLDGRGLASGVSNESGAIPRFSDTVLTVPVSISAFSAIRQLLARVSDSQSDDNALSRPITYSLKGKLGASGASLATRFTDKGEMNLFTNKHNTDDDSRDGDT